MENERDALTQKTTRLHLAMEAEETLRRSEEFPDNPLAMGYFYDLFRDLFTDGFTLPEAKKIIGTMCVQVPDELISAAGAVPFRLCSGAFSYDQIGADFMPAKSCPVVRSTYGMLHINESLWGDKLSAVVIPTTCDQKKKVTERITDLSYNVYSLEMPSSKDSEAARFYWQEAVKQFTLDLQHITGKKITKKKVQQAIVKKTQAAELYRKLYELRKSDPAPLFGKDMLLVTNAYFLDDIDMWMGAVKELITEIEERKARKFSAGNRNAPRILLTGSPPIFPNIKVPILIEQSGGIIVADEVCSSSRLLYDSVAYDEANLNDMVPAIADRYLKPCTCPCLTPNTDRQRKLADMVSDFAVDGVIYQAFSGCLPYEMEQNQISHEMEKQGVPMLYVETDYSPEDQGQLSTRVEAFIESIKFRKRKRTPELMANQ
jgi:benzoyl-CoA reductase/2-hydroxyglutaryl-CoA dehydratase subunit BcrC/BadD/HgdB